MSAGNGTDRAFERCADVTARSGSNFYLAFLPMAPARRDGIFAVYAFCRVVDDIVDEPAEGTDPRRELDLWRERVGDIVRGRVAKGSPEVALALAETHRRYRLREEDLLAVIDGVAMDIGDAPRHAKRSDLALYCERVAGRVGCLCLRVFGVGDEARPYALALGEAFQLTNILRDVPRDADIGRMYLPLELLARHGASEADVLAGRRTPQLGAVLHELGDEALGLFDRAEGLVEPSQRPTLFPALIMSAIYRRVLMKLRASDYDSWSGRVTLPKSVKAMLALGVFARDRVLRTW